MKRVRGGRSKKPKIKTVRLNDKHANSLRLSHILVLIIFVLIGFGAVFSGYAYLYNQYKQQQTNYTIARDQLDYGAVLPQPIDKATFYLLTGGVILAFVGTAVTIFLIIKHNSKHHVYKVASGHYVPVPGRKANASQSSPFAVGQSEESRRKAQEAVNKSIPVGDNSPEEKPKSPPRKILLQ